MPSHTGPGLLREGARGVFAGKEMIGPRAALGVVKERKSGSRVCLGCTTSDRDIPVSALVGVVESTKRGL